MESEKNWEQLATQKRDSILAAIPKEWHLENIPTPEEQRDVSGTYIDQFLSSQEKEITETDAVGIVEKTTTGQWKAVDVCRSFCHRASIAHQLVHCLHEVFFDAALKIAEALDAYYAEHKKPIGPLHGLPVSLKDQFHVKGVETTMGYVGWIGTFQGKPGDPRSYTYESEMVRELRELGAVLYVKTSVPHTLMAGETVNNIIGYTQNSANRFLSSGGSSGGEGSLIGCKGSPVGFGTDIGGSIRIPAAFNGLYGVKPSTGRMPYEGMANSMDGQNTVLSVVGPLAPSVGALRLVMKGLLETKPWLHDPMVHEIPWREEQAQLPSKLAFGVIKHDGVVGCTPPVRRAIDTIVEKLENAGHEVFEWHDPSHQHINELCFATWRFDGGEDVHSAFGLSGEPIAPQITKAFGDKLIEQYKASDIMAVNIGKREAQKEYMDFWNNSAAFTTTRRPVDAVISPLAPWPAARVNQYDYYGYTTWVNLLDYTSVVVPVLRADKTVDKMDADFKPLNDIDKLCHESYDPEVYDGAKVSVQFVGRRLQEEKMLAIADVATAALKA